ncbi:DUF6247 family protein [Nonomuraea sp. NPDC049421]|uniref:DUF6247 family protein n=1 Tax=Nonomuraea sp. NPDC049421 TaxID=3155275 RepID=UPI00342425B6
MPEVFPWVRHLSSDELRAFTRELVEALSDAAELDVDATSQEVIAGWRATARIKADPAQYARLVRRRAATSARPRTHLLGTRRTPSRPGISINAGR